MHSLSQAGLHSTQTLFFMMYPEEHWEQSVPDEHFVHPKGQALQTELLE